MDDMIWTELNITVSTKDADEAAAIAQMVVPYGIYIEDYSDLRTEAPKIAHIDLIDEDLLAKATDVAVIHLYLEPTENPNEAVSFLTERLSDAGIRYTIGSGTMREEEWATAWKQYYHPLTIGERLLVCPSWELSEPKDDQVRLILDPGMAFGTGTHETTRLCLEFLERFAGPGKAMLDVGSGSGILSIAAALLGCEPCVGVEIDATAVKVANENSAINGTTGRVTYLNGDLVAKVTGTYDIVCANIVADVILRLLPDLGRYLSKDSVFIASGIIAEREDDVLAGLAAYGYTLMERKEQSGWVALLCRKSEEEK